MLFKSRYRILLSIPRCAPSFEGLGLTYSFRYEIDGRRKVIN